MVTGALPYEEVRRAFVVDDALQAADLDRRDAGKVPSLRVLEGAELKSERSQNTETPYAVIVGVLGESAILESLEQDGGLPQADALRSERESFMLRTVEHPLPGVARALVIAGADARGAIYGIYQISQMIGVSPWYWYADAPVQTRDRIDIEELGLPGEGMLEHGPDVRYRGIFINDEERTIDWCGDHFPAGHGTPDVNFYRHVFELMLRLRLNTLWPAMHPGTSCFNEYRENDHMVNAEEAMRYGIIVSASHCEMLLRNNVSEWEPWVKAHRDDYDWMGDEGEATFDYTRHKDAILAYWRERLEENRQFENIYPLGIRGVHDGSFRCRDLAKTFGSKVAMMADVIREQRRLIAEAFGAPDAVPQMFVPYKEMGELYNAGLREHIPDDVILLWAEDNYGYLRQVPDERERSRSGGSGVYYHVSYWGYPKSWLWLNSIQYPLMVQELRRAYATGAKACWILNVGDIVPGHIAMELYARLSWRVDDFAGDDAMETFYLLHAKRDFQLGSGEAREVASAIADYSRLCGTKRAEFYGVGNASNMKSAGFNEAWEFPFSATANGDETLRLVERCGSIRKRLEAVERVMDEDDRASLYLQLTHAVISYEAVAREYAYFWKYRLCAAQGRYRSAQIYRDLSLAAVKDIEAAQRRFWNVNGGKWRKAIGYSHPIDWPGYVSNEGVVLLDDSRFAIPRPIADIGACAEGSSVAGTGLLRFGAQREHERHYIDVFATGEECERWRAEADPWIRLSEMQGTITSERRVMVSVDYGRLDRDRVAVGSVRIYRDRGSASVPVATITVEADPRIVAFDGPSFVQTGVAIVIDAVHPSASEKGVHGDFWLPVRGLGPRIGAMKAVPETAARVDHDFADAARLKYHVYFRVSGTYRVTFHRIPTLNEGSGDTSCAPRHDYDYLSDSPFSCRTAIGLDDDVPSRAVLRGANNWMDMRWAGNIMRMSEPLTCMLRVPSVGWHDVVIYRSDAAITFTHLTLEAESSAPDDSLTSGSESPNSVAPEDSWTCGVATLPAELG